MSDGGFSPTALAVSSAPAALPAALQAVRMARGLTQAGLAEASGISQAMISKAESGLVELDRERLKQVCAALHCPASLLRSELDLATTDTCVFHRKRSSTSVSQAKQARALVALLQLRVEALYLLVTGPALAIPKTAPTADGYVTPEDVARQVRRVLEVPHGPIEDLIHLVEAAGMPAASMPLGGRRLDALSYWPPKKRPVMLINQHAPGDRQRFTVAHELGHAVMHASDSETVAASGATNTDREREREADRFAAELLMPAAEARSELRRLSGSLAALGPLKRKWKVSRAMLLYRAREVDTLTENQYRRAVTEMSAAGWRINEPDPLSPEQPKALEAALQEACNRYDITTIASTLGAFPESLPNVFREGTA